MRPAPESNQANPPRSAAWTILIGCLLALAGTGTAIAQDQAATTVDAKGAVLASRSLVTWADPNSARSTLRARDLRPALRRGIEPQISQKLAQAFPIAVRRVSENRGCQELFARLGADGVVALARTLYYPPSAAQVRQACSWALALTNVGSPATRLCPGFAKLSNERAALVLVHEALHLAGLPEAPLVPGAQTSAQINDMVKEGCHF